ncbi:MAG: carboxypeptidase-like regulatory domain-containing protein [Chitinophagaceae bacterium]|nr:carboxypeptidase-like regulatory domain-containing protein [Chitinophagaceae bacterium]
MKKAVLSQFLNRKKLSFQNRYNLLWVCLCSCLLLITTGLNAQTIADTMLIPRADTLNLLADTLTGIKTDTPKNEIKMMEKKSISPKGSFTLEGVIKDYTTAEPLSFATVSFTGTGFGKRADIDGKFSFLLEEWPSDSLTISVIGYTKKIIPIDRKAAFQSLKIELERSAFQMKDFVIKFDRDPALALVKKVIKNKSFNNYDKAGNYSYEVYNKLEMDINKIPKKAFRQSPILKKFDFVQSFIDSTSEEKPFLPLFLTETISDFYYQSKPKKSKEYIRGSRISGYKNQSVSQMLGSMYQNINIYKNSILIFDVDFVSPIANDAPTFYKYQLMDTQVVNGKTCYQVAFTPKRSGEHTFNGDFWIHDTDFAVQKVNMIVTKEQNINWVNKVTMMQEFTCFEDTLWFLTKDKFYVDFLPPHGDKVAGFLGRKTTTYRNIVVNDPAIEQIIENKKKVSDTELDPEAENRNEDYWNSVRHETLSKNEKSIYKMIDTIQSLPIYKKYYSILYLLGTGIKEVGPLEIGPIYNLYSSNVIEGRRLRLTLGTTPKLFKDVYLRGYIAYGFNDERVKYMGSALWLLRRQPRSYIYAEYKHDIDNTVNQYDAAGSLDNIFSSIGRKSGVPWKLAFVDKQRLEYYNSYFNGFSYMLSFERKDFTPYNPLPYINILYNNDGLNTNTITVNESGLELRYAHQEKFIEGNYYRSSIGTKYPVFKFYAGIGIKGFLDADYQFTKLRLTISDYQSLGRFGSLYYNVFAGKIFGKLPYPILEIHPGNEFYYYAAHSFNMMYRYEYISDAYAGLIMEHSMGSLFFKYIPYVKKMKIRTFWNMKGVYGNLSTANQAINMNKGFDFQTLAKSPYLEAGTGLENIFKVLRVDFVWRLLPYRNNNDTPSRRFGIFGSLKFAF